MMTPDHPDVAFVCTANAEVGFGHLRRCLILARELRQAGLRVSLGGQLDAAARAVVARELPVALAEGDPPPAPLAVIDCMFDPQEPDWYDREFIAVVARRHAGTVLITSSLQAPADLPADVVVGHMLEPVSNPRYELHRGLAWAPVDPAAAAFRNDAREYPEPIRRVLVAFGNWHDPAGLFLALDGLRLAGSDAEIQVLLPPALRSREDEIRQRTRGLRLEILKDVPSVLPLLRDCDLLVGSYGNMTFEALALGVPVAVIAIKPFMARYAERLAAEDCLVCAGEMGRLEATALAGELRQLDAARRGLLGCNGRRLVDGAGLQRLAGLLKERLAGRAASVAHHPAAGAWNLPRPAPIP